MNQAGQYARGIACHEAGHAVVGWALGVRVKGCRVFYDDAKGWKGGTDADVAEVGQLRLPQRIAFFAAGYTAEGIFGHPIPHDRAADDDNANIYLALIAGGIPEDDHPTRIVEGNNIAGEYLETLRAKVIELAEYLARCGHVDDASEFLRSVE
jgi:hypothetical protein